MAANFGEKALQIAEKSENQEYISKYRNNPALVHKVLGNFSGARTLPEKAIHSDERNFGEDHPTTARAYSNLATVMMDLKEYKEARILLEKAERIFKSKLGEEHPNTMVVSNWLKELAKQEGKGG